MPLRPLPAVPRRWVRRAALFFALWGIVLLAPEEIGAQEDEPRARVEPGTGGLALDLAAVLDDGGLRRALHSGLPIRIEVSVELWRDGFFDQQEAGGNWRASVLHDAVTQTYRFQVEDEEAVSLPNLDRVAQELQAGFASEVRPVRPGRYYYLAEVEMQTLSLSDLEELRRWLQGDLAPVVGGTERTETAVARGLRRVMVRALGLPARREKLRTPPFDWPPPDPPPGPAGSPGRPRDAGATGRAESGAKGPGPEAADPAVSLEAIGGTNEPRGRPPARGEAPPSFDLPGLVFDTLPVDSSGFPCARAP